MDRVLLAVFTFYREEPDLWGRLDPLLDCRIIRGWGVVRIECRDRWHREQINGLLELLRPPLEALRLARQISLQAPGLEPLTYPVTVPLPSSLLT